MKIPTFGKFADRRQPAIEASDKNDTSDLLADLLHNVGRTVETCGAILRRTGFGPGEALGHPMAFSSGSAEGSSIAKSSFAAVGLQAYVAALGCPTEICVALLATARGINPDIPVTISWGDSPGPTKGRVAEADVVHRIVGDHRFSTPGVYTITVSIYHPDSALTVESRAIVGTPSQRFLSEVHEMLLDRPINQDDLERWDRGMDLAAERENAVVKIQRSRDYRVSLVRRIYEDLLHRKPLPSEIESELSALEEGHTTTQLKERILRSREYFDERAASSADEFVKVLFADLLGRLATTEERVDAERSVETGSVEPLVSRIVNEIETRARLIQGVYKRYTPNASQKDFPFWLIDNVKAAAEEEITAKLLASFWNKYLALPTMLDTDYTNTPPLVDTSSLNWTHDFVGGTTYLANDEPTNEWVPILNSHIIVELGSFNLTGLSGTAVEPALSQADLPFTHPFANDPVDGKENPWGHFGNDFTFDVAPDPRYWPLLAPSNVDLDQSLANYGLSWFKAENTAPWYALDDDFRASLESARTDLQLDVPGLLHVEIDQGLMPPEYRPQHGDRVVVWGRWIVDAGHDSFGTEIHPPMLVACARRHFPTSKFELASLFDDKTDSTIIGRPYLVSQRFPSRGLRDEIKAQLTEAGLSQRSMVELNTGLFAGLFGSYLLSYTVRPPTPRRTPQDELWVTFDFTARQGVTAYVLNEGNDGVQVLVKINGGTPPPLPPLGEQKAHIRLEDLPDSQQVISALDKVIDDNAPWGYIRDHVKDVAHKGALMKWYPQQIAASPLDGTNEVSVAVNALPMIGDAEIATHNSNGMVEDNSQPYPIYGHLSVYWKRG